MELDVTQCIGCRKGIGLFIKEKDKTFTHLDLFATPEAGHSYKCTNQKIIEKHVKKNKGKGTYLADDELQAFYIDQEDWWYDFIDLASDTFTNNDELNEFFNRGEKGDKMWNKPNNVMEIELLTIARERGVEVIKDYYPSLIKWRIENGVGDG